MSDSRRPLAGIRVLDLSRVVSGPLCGRLLADLGADVVKIEPPEGDTTRGVPPFVSGVSAYYAQMNAGKRNISIDLKAPGAPELVARLARTADVLIENFRPGVLARFGLDAPALRAANPRLVYCSVTGWGQDGPWRDRRAYAPLVHADIGTLELAARLRGRRPEPEVHQHGDVYTAVIASNAVLAALVQRGITGEGQHLDVAMGQAAVYVNEWAAAGMQPPEQEWGGFDTWNHHAYPLGDGTYVTLVGNPVRLFPLWVRSLGGDAALLDDPRFATPEARASNVAAMVEVMDTFTVRCADFEALETALGDPWMLAAQLRSVGELAGTEWALQRGLTAEVRPGLPVPAAPWASDGAEIGTAPWVADRGAHNVEVLAELGLDATQIDTLTAAGVLRA
jgi:crotonobetainyl-CoA:carnitine CoA-transferase CaiB-like acyl-CoA transferase